MSAETKKRVDWMIGFDEPDQTWYLGINKGGATIRLNGHYLTEASARIDLDFLRREYEAAAEKAGKEGSLFD